MKVRVFLCLLLLASAAANAGAVDVTGRWRVAISLGDETITGVALLKQTGDKVTGSIGHDERNQHPLHGVVKGNLVTLTTHPRPERSVAFDKCYLTVDGERMTGTTERKGSSDRGPSSSSGRSGNSRSAWFANRIIVDGNVAQTGRP